MASKNQDKSNYEKMWQQAFEDAEMRPPAHLWNNIDNQLTRQESGKFKRGFLFYRAVAAACLLCLVGLGVYTVHDRLTQQQNSNLSIADEQPEDHLTDSAPADTKSAVATRQDTSQEDQAERHQDLPEQEVLAEKAPATANTAGRHTQHISSLASNTKNKQASPSVIKSKQPAITSMLADDHEPDQKHHVNSEIRSIASNGLYEAPVKGMAWIQEIDRLYLVPNPYATERRKENKSKPTFFAGLDFSGNYFDPNFSAGSAYEAAAPAALLDRSNSYSELFKGSTEDYTTPNGPAANAPGINNTPRVSLSYGANVGINLGKHISLESGIDYGKFNTTTETNLALESIASDKRYPLLASNSTYAATNNVSLTSTTELTNSFELLTVPMKLGYNLHFEKVALFISSGMAANFFIQNSISDASGKFATMNIQSDAASPYNKVFYSGVISGGINYNVSGNYFLTLSPEYSFSVTPMTNDRTFITSQPYIFGVDFGLRYEFK